MRNPAPCGLIIAAALSLGASTVQAAPWCSTHGGMSCAYSSFEQCLTAIRGVGGSCVVNPAESARRQPPPAITRAPRPKREPEKKPAAVMPRDKPSQPPPVPVAEPPRPPAPHQAVKSFAQGRMLILSGQYEKGIAAMLALGQDDRPDIAVSVGYANYKLGRRDEAKRWYEKALAADPNHVATLANYGLMLAEQGDVEKARADLEKIKTLCGGTNCREYRDLAAAIGSR
jgi:hypothetical protein